MDERTGEVSDPVERREIDLHRRVCVVKTDTVEIRPARSAAVIPLIGFLLGVLALVAVLFWLERLPFLLVLLLMVGAILLVPFSAMGLVYSVYGASVIIDRGKGTVVWQQGLLGMGVGTRELVPFAKIERLEVEEVRGAEQSVPDDLAQFEVRLLKTGGRTLPLGQATVPRGLASEGLARACEVGEAVAALAEKPLVVVGEERQPGRRRRRRTGRRTSTVT
jgi:hypothetical protein